jgi:hypothetical protein
LSYEQIEKKSPDRTSQRTAKSRRWLQYQPEEIRNNI